VKVTKNQAIQLIIVVILWIISGLTLNRFFSPLITNAQEPTFTIPTAAHIMQDGQRAKIVGIVNRSGGQLEQGGPVRENKTVITELDQKFFINWKGAAYLLAGGDGEPAVATSGTCIEFKDLTYYEVGC
jgi:hypothetical protein